MKQIKLLGVLAIALTLGLAACNGGGDQSQEGQQSAEKCKSHKWGEYVTIKEATCTEDGSQERVCSVCGEKQTKVIKAAHKYGEFTTTKEATCQEKGSKERECTVCHAKDVQEIPLADHTYAKADDGSDVVVWTTEPSCEVAGVGEKECTVCHEKTAVNQDALGHNFVKGDDGQDVVTWTQEATCTLKGVGTKHCDRCNKDIAYTVDALGHHLVLQDDGSQPEAGKAKVRIYKCDRTGCDYATFGFKATEVSPNAGRLVDETDPETGEVGKRFWGRPIGNAMELDPETGSASGNDAVKVFDRTVQGDLFEYVFDLTAEQITALGDAIVCYADARPAEHMGGMDFWACDPNAQEWTPGYYIDDQHEDQTPISDYRYILYVDDQPVEFDSTMKAPVARASGTQPARGKFLMPYVFHFTAGTHKISLRMAGGYRSVFFNFIFESYEEPENVPVEPAAPNWPAACPSLIDTSAWTAGTPAQNAAGKTYTPLSGTGKVGVKIAIGDTSSGSYSSNKMSSSADSGVTYQVKAPKAGLYEVIMKAKVSASGDDYAFSNRINKITLNGWASQVNIYGTRMWNDAGLDHDNKLQFVLAVVNLTGEEDSLYIENRYYRFDFDMASDVIFAEI